MRKTKLTKEQQEKFKWLMNANTVNEDVEVSKFGHLIWKGGIWKYGTWKYGTWEDGVWEGGVWRNGTWKNGIWEGGFWEGGTWEDGLMWSNLKQKYIHVKWNKDKKNLRRI